MNKVNIGSLFCFIFFFCLPISDVNATYPPSFSDCLIGDGEEYDQVDACQQLLRSNSKNYKLHIALTKALDKRQKYKQALKAYDNALKAFPNDDYLLKKRLITQSNHKEQQWLLNKKQTESSKAAINSTSKSSSNFRLNKIRCTRLTGQAALKACREAIKINTKDAALFISVGDIYASQQKNHQAVAAYKEAVKLAPNDHKTAEKLKKLIQRQNTEKNKKKVITKAKVKPEPTKKVTKPKVIETSTLLSPSNNSIAIVKPKKPELKPKLKPELKPEQQEFIEQLNLLGSLKQQGIITEEDYDQRKKALLDSTFRVSPIAQNKVASNKTHIDPEKNTGRSYADLNFGNYHALIIGNNQYKHLPKLETAVNDAQELASLLKSHYGFKVKLLMNANRYDTLKAMSEYRNTLTKDDNLLIYYAGHGILDKASERGYWLPTDAELDFTSNWISTSEVTDTLKALQSWHVLVVADSCYSGTLARSISIKFKNPEKKYSLIQRLLKKKSRTVITSGGLEPVTDSGSDNHSVFSAALLDVLKNTNDVIEAEEVFSRLRDNVILNADQTPEYSNVRKVGHNGGDFIFRRQ
ncbi:MAG: hypothetical protein GY694_11725 [Gammaproteobacteria bacterium]|nr:hypothetical protein [Gammaproteobacteria bacterium]